MRECEARAAATALGASAVHFLPFCDPVAGPGDALYHIDATLDQFSAAIAEVMLQLGPDVVLTHGSNGEYGHPQHIFTRQAVFAALNRLKPWQPRQVWSWGGAYPDPVKPRFINNDDPGDLVLDVQPWIDRKIAAFEAHRTQHGLFLRKNPDQTPTEIAIRVESFKRWPAWERSDEER